MERTYIEVCNEINAIEKEISNLKEVKEKRVAELKKERDLLFKDWQSKKIISYRKYIRKLCFVGFVGNEKKDIGILELVTKTRSKEKPFLYKIKNNYSYYDYFEPVTIDNIQEFICKE